MHSCRFCIANNASKLFRSPTYYTSPKCTKVTPRITITRTNLLNRTSMTTPTHRLQDKPHCRGLHTVRLSTSIFTLATCMPACCKPVALLLVVEFFQVLYEPMTVTQNNAANVVHSQSARPSTKPY